MGIFLLVFSQSLINMPGVFTEDVSTQKGLGLFNKFLSDKTYVSGYAPSADDFELLDKFNEAPPTKFCNVARWYNHIKSFEDERDQICGGSSSKAETPAAAADDDDDDDIDLFGDDDDDEEAERLREELIEQRAREQLEKNKLKDKPVAKSSILFDVKPWDSETDLLELEKKIRQISMEGLVWTAAELKPIAFGVNKLTIMCTIVDDLVSSDNLQEQIEAFEDDVQSVDIAAFVKI